MGAASSPIKARLDIKVAIYKESGRATNTERLCRVKTRLHAHSRVAGALDNTHFHTYIPYIQARARARERKRARKGDTRKRTRGGTGRTYLHIESVSQGK